MIKVYQYQIMHEGGATVGPSWMHRKEAADYLKKEVQKARPKEKFKIRRYWVRAPKHVFSAVKPERVK